MLSIRCAFLVFSFTVIFQVYADKSCQFVSKVIMDRLVLETEGVVSEDLADLFHEV